MQGGVAGVHECECARQISGMDRVHDRLSGAGPASLRQCPVGEQRPEMGVVESAAARRRARNGRLDACVGVVAYLLSGDAGHAYQIDGAMPRSPTTHRLAFATAG
jgi:hypothetical protein